MYQVPPPQKNGTGIRFQSSSYRKERRKLMFKKDRQTDVQAFKYIAFCAGRYFAQMPENLINGHVYCIDNDASKWGTVINGCLVVSPQTLLEEIKEELFINIFTIVFYDDICNQLLSMGFCENKHFSLFKPFQSWFNNPSIIFNAAYVTAWGNVFGDYYEFGTHEGKSLITAYKTLSQVGHYFMLGFMGNSKNTSVINKRSALSFQCFAFDSFEGLPKPTGIDCSEEFFEGDYKGDYQRLISSIKTENIDMGRVHIIKGWYCDLDYQIKESYNMNKARIIHIDCDLYESTRDALNFCSTLIQDGTVIIFDDWFCFKGHPLRGEQLAFKEWQIANPKFLCSEYMREVPFRNSFIINII